MFIKNILNALCDNITSFLQYKDIIIPTWLSIIIGITIFHYCVTCLLSEWVNMLFLSINRN